LGFGFLSKITHEKPMLRLQNARPAFKGKRKLAVQGKEDVRGMVLARLKSGEEGATKLP